MAAEMHINDPELGHICVRPITVDEHMQILHRVQDVDIDQGEAVIRPGHRPLSEAEKKVPRVQAQIEQIRKDLYMHAVVRAAVIEPVPPTLDAALVDAYAPLAMYIGPGGGWTPEAVQRTYEAAIGTRKLEMARCRERPVDIEDLPTLEDRSNV
jgi:hypothetical protein